MNKIMNLSEKTLKRLAIGSAIVAIVVTIIGIKVIDNNIITKEEAIENLDNSLDERRSGEHMRFENLYGEE